MILVERVGRDNCVCVLTLCRKSSMNAFNRSMANALLSALLSFDSDPSALVCALVGDGHNFCAGADLKAMASGDAVQMNELNEAMEDPAPMGPSRIELGKPLLVAVDGYCVAGGLELALLGDIRLATERAVFGVFCRRYGVPLIDGGTVRLPRVIGQGRALDMILTGRAVSAREALSFGLVNRIVGDPTQLRPQAIELAERIASFPQACMRADRRSALGQWTLPLRDALHAEFQGAIHSNLFAQMEPQAFIKSQSIRSRL
jgi:enoyl-CoA hydratase/carnithine racemase